MMNCPGCGAANSVRKETCYQCGAPLHVPEAGEKPETNSPDEPKICAECCHACIFPPPGSRLKGDEIWCAHLESAIDGNTPARNCYAKPFEWRREHILD
jgi:hypothetical protein